MSGHATHMNKKLRCIAMTLAGSLLLTATASADDEDRRRAYNERQAQQDRIYQIENRIKETEPRRRDAPARSENISDNEVREIQNVVRDVLPHAIVNISTVVTGCPCEDGPACTDQVWLTATKGEDTYGLQLSRINNHWTIGPIQAWWLKYRGIKPDHWTAGYWWSHEQTYEESIENFPECVQSSLLDRSTTKK